VDCHPTESGDGFVRSRWAPEAPPKCNSTKFLFWTRRGRNRIGMEQPIWNFEQEPFDQPVDETSINLRAYFDRMSDEKMQEFQAEWTDEQVMKWDGNFKSDGSLMLLCCMRDVEIGEYRRVIAECINYRDRVRPMLSGS
jgi:hypothetical protein